MKVTKKPIYAFEKTPDGSTTATYTVEIDGEEYRTFVIGTSESDAFKTLKQRVSKSLLNSKHGEVFRRNNRDVDVVLGTPTKSRPDEVLQRKQSKEPEQQEEKTISQSQNSTNPQKDKPKNIFVKGRKKNHVKWQRHRDRIDLDGVGDIELKEPVPELFLRPGDEKIQSKNNSAIILGRDYSPRNSKMKYSRSLFDREYNSGFSDHMGAGAIDIVAGRMAPFALESIDGDPLVFAPSFNTFRPPELQDYDLEYGKHPGMVMDAARIYISQMTIIDKNFNIKEDIRGAGAVADTAAPTSGIMLKADKVRLHSRQDIKIVTGGPYEYVNSQGNTITRNNGIHLIAENGEDRDGTVVPQQPMVLGNNLVDCINSILQLIKQLNDRVDTFVAQQNKFNIQIGTGFDMLPVPSGLSVRDPKTQWETLVTTIKGIENRIDGFKIDVNNFNRITNYLTDTNKETSILSRFNTVN